MSCEACSGEERTYLASSRGMCRTCGQVCEARYVADGDAVYLERICPTHGKSKALVAEDFGWYVEAMRFPSRSSGLRIGESSGTTKTHLVGRVVARE